MQHAVQREIDIIGYDCGWGCGDYGCEDGPEAAEISLIAEYFLNNGRSARTIDLALRELGDRSAYETKHDTYPMTVRSVTKLAETCYQTIKNGRSPVVIGGDHSSAIGTWAGVTSALELEEDFGLIWIDAHMDAHTPETSDEGKWGGWWHGMPIACLTGNGDEKFTNLINAKNKIKPKHLALIGIRSFEPGEAEYVKEHNIPVFMAGEVQLRGFQSVFRDAVAHVKAHCSAFGLSIDLDGFDPQDAPGVGTPEQNGVLAHQALEALARLGNEARFKGLEIVEYNPHNDKDKKTAKLIHDLVRVIYT